MQPAADLDAVDSIRPTHPRLAAAQSAVAEKAAELDLAAAEAEAAAQANQLELEAQRQQAEAEVRERALLSEIDAAIDSGNLASTQEDNAIQLVNDAWNTFDEPSPLLVERTQRIAGLLMFEASSALQSENPQLAAALAAQLDNLPLATIPGKGELDADISEALRLANAVIEPARRTRMVPPDYPRNAARRGVEGWVHLSFNISPLGDVTDINIIESTPEDTFDEAAAAAVSEWKYQPRTVDGEPTEEPMEVRLQFSL